MTPLTGFSPDADQTAPGLLSDCDNLIPALIGMEGAPEPVAPSGIPPLPAACRGAAVVYKLNNTRRMLAATSAGIYELIAGAWVDQSRVGGYTGSDDSRWSIAKFGDATLMANGAQPIQRSTTGAFADIATAPAAEVIFSAGSFVMALNTDGSTDQWHCCAVFDDTDWTPSLTTQSASGRLVATPGKLTAGARLGEYAIAYKERSIYLGQYVGPPAIWDWSQISGGDSGCVGKLAICDIGGAHFFVGPDNFWLFDGTRPIPIGDGIVRRWFIEQSSADYLYKTTCVFDRENNRVWVFYPKAGSSECDGVLVYHVQSKQWGRADRSVQTALMHVSPGITFDTWDTAGSSFEALPSVGFDSPFWSSGARVLSVFDAANQLQSYTGNSVSSSLTTGEVGDDDALSKLQQIRLRYSSAPSAATVQTLYSSNSGTGFVIGASGSLNDGKFDVLRSARWHKATVSFTGPVRITHINATFKPAGRR
ncbi:hypothetical protein [Pseudomonas sp.]|uniref:hypothetical protein n=1 Tax=Pseudomonas sp. TaxID=306 RepID=UPI002587D489|nr:hypothetical protein [Pseudomonas sp.]